MKFRYTLGPYRSRVRRNAFSIALPIQFRRTLAQPGGVCVDELPVLKLVQPAPKRRARRPQTPPPDTFDDLEIDDRRKLKLWCRDKYPQFAHRKPGGFYDQAEFCLDWHRSEDRWRRDWPSTIRNWIRRSAEFADERGKRRPNEKPQMSEGRSGVRQPTRIRDTLGDLLGHLKD